MTRSTPMWRRYATLFGRNIRGDIEDELKFHLEARTRELVDAGWPPRAAEEEAHRLFGDRDAIAAECREIKTRFEQRRQMHAYLSGIAADIHFALRGFRRTPGLAVIMVLTLALGIGATTAIFSVVNAVLLQPLPYATPERLVRIVENVPAAEAFDGVAVRRDSINPAEVASWRASESLSDVAVIAQESRTLATDSGAVQLYGARVSPALFRMRGVAPLLGRGLLAEEERPDADTIVLSEAAWREHLGSDPRIVGRVLSLDGRALTVVGVMPPEFGPDAYWTPFFAAPQPPGFVSFLAGSARLRDGVSLDAASAEINAIGSGLRGIVPDPGAKPRFELVRELDQITSRVVPALRVLVVAVAAVLLIVCTNVATLLLVRGTRRQQEIAIRRSLGATRGRIVRLVLAESLALAAIAGAVGVGFALAAVQVLKSVAIVDLPRRFFIGAAILPRAGEIALNPSVLAFVALLVLVTSALFGMWTALRLSRFGERGHHAAAQISASANNTRAGQVLATVQLGLAMTLLIGAGLLLHSFFKLATVDPGFDPRGVLSFELVVPGDSSAERRLEVAAALASRLQDHPRVASAGFIDIPPLGVGNILFTSDAFVPEGMTGAEFSEAESALSPNERTQLRVASSGYLRALGARLTEGSWIEDGASNAARQTVLVSRAFAQRYFLGSSAVGTTLRSGQFGNATIVGVVDDIRLNSLEGAPDRIVFREPGQMLAAQRARQAQPSPQMGPFFLTNGYNSITFAARTDGEPLAILADLRAMARDIDPSFAIDAAIPMELVRSGVTTRPRFYAVLLGTFGALAGFIAAIGIYGVLAYLVSQRTKEVGIRMALGARPANVLQLVLRRGVTMIAVGLTAGVLGALGLTRYLEGMLYGIAALDGTTYAVVIAAFAAVAVLASYVPARRATRIDPLAALRQDG